MDDITLSAFIGGFFIGVLSRSLFDLGVWFSLFVLILGLSVLTFSLFAKRKRTLFIAGLFILSASTGLLRFNLLDAKQTPSLLNQFIGSSIRAEGIIVDEPDVRERNTNYTVRLERVFGEEVSAKVRVIAESYPEFSYGELIVLGGVLEKPESFETDTGRYFDYQEFLSKDDIYYEMLFPTLEFIAGARGNIVKNTLFEMKEAFLDRIRTLIPEPQASLLGGLVVGAKQSLGSKLQDDFRKTGIIHIVVLSGYNVTIVADAFMRAFSFLPRFFNMSLGALAIILFAFMTGASATIVRASIMALLVVLSRITNRAYDITRALFIAGFLMVLHSPKILVHDTSFQLSFLATLGLIWLAPLLEKYFSFIPTRFQLRGFATATVSTQVFVLPLLLYKTGIFSLVALPVNLLVLATIPQTMLFGFLAGMIGFLSTILALPFAFVAHLLLSYQLAVVELFARLPFASVEVGVFSFWFVCVSYAAYAFVLLRVHRKRLTPSEPFSTLQ